jgi:hypothetical protein
MNGVHGCAMKSLQSGGATFVRHFQDVMEVALPFGSPEFLRILVAGGAPPSVDTS